MTPEPMPPNDPDDDLDAYPGLPAERARRLAAERGWRTVRELPPDAVVTLEYVAGRLNLTVRDGRVERCWRG